MSSEVMISARGLSKAYRIYRSPEDRVKELVLRRRYHEEFWAVRDVDLTVSRTARVARGTSSQLTSINPPPRPTEIS